MKINAVLLVPVCIAALSGELVWKLLDASGPRFSEPSLVRIGWTPPQTSIDPDYVKAAQAFLGNGLADPRKGQFSNVKISIGDAATQRSTTETDTYGWVSADRKHAVLFDGVAYPIDAVPTPADLDATIDRLLQGSTAVHGMSPIPLGAQSASLPALLLLVDKPELAERVAKTWRPYHGNSGWARFLATQLWERYNMQSAQALMARDDRAGLEWSKQLLLVAKVRDELHLTGDLGPPVSPGDPTEYARRLMNDFERRVEHPKIEPVDVAAVEKLGKEDRIKALIDDLDTIGAVQRSQPGEPDYIEDPVYKAIYDQGGAAMPELIDALETDRRFSRTVSFGRDFIPYRTIHPVRSIVWNLIVYIWPSATRWQKSQLEIPSAAVLRNAWNSEGSLTEPERSLKVLEDDGAKHQDWRQAAVDLVKPADEIHYGQNRIRLSQNPHAPMTGEPLRAQRGKEISDILAKRAVQMASVRTDNAMDLFECGEALQVAHCLAKWDPTAATDCLKTVCADSIATCVRLKDYGSPSSTMAAPFGIAVSDLVKAGDPAAAKTYETFAVNECLPPQPFLDVNVFRPLWEAPTNSAIQEAGRHFLSWWETRLAGSDPKEATAAASAIVIQYPSTPLLSVRTYRRLLVSGLKSKLVVGSILVDKFGIRYTTASGAAGMWQIGPDEKNATLTGSREISLGDYVARALYTAGVREIPAFHILAPADQRATERKTMADWLSDDKRDWMGMIEASPYFQTYRYER